MEYFKKMKIKSYIEIDFKYIYRLNVLIDWLE